MKKRILSIALTVCMILTMLPGPLPAAAAANTGEKFSDVKPADWFYEAIQYVCGSGMMNGVGNNTFAPNATTTRGMIVTILARMEGVDTNTGSPWYTAGCAWAVSAGISDGTDMEGQITREQLAVMLYRYAQLKGYDTGAEADISGFTDSDSTSGWAKEAMQWAVGIGLINGVGENTLDPQGSATRAQVAMILMRFCQFFAGADAPAQSPEDSKENNKEENKDNSGSDSNTPVVPDVPVIWPDSGEDGQTGDYELIKVIPGAESTTVLTEAGVSELLQSRGFVDYPVVYGSLSTGEDVDERTISSDSTDTHPVYQTFYFSEKNEELWTLYVINGDIFVYPVSFNLESDLGAELLVSESGTITCYYADTDSFYVTVPYQTAAIVLTVGEINADTLDSLSIAEICSKTGATPPAQEENSEAGLTVTTYCLDEEAAPVSLYSDETSLLTASAVSASSDPTIIVSLGDSYSSGEGIEPFYGQDKDLVQKVLDKDWLAHRSTLAWPTLLQIPGVSKTTGIYRVDGNGVNTTSADVQWYFAAASGAETFHFKNAQEKTYYKKYALGALHKEGSSWLPAQLNIFKTYDLTGKVDYVTMTIGGNDVDFTAIITSCVIYSTYLDAGIGDSVPVDDMIADLWANFNTTKRLLKQAYLDTIEAAGEQASIIVAGYPKLLEKNGKGAAISKHEAQVVNENVTKFNKELRNIVTQLYNSGKNIYFVDVEDAFNGHEAYSSNEYITEVKLWKQDEDLDDRNVKWPVTASSYSMHPNEKGAIAYANCVNERIAEVAKNITISGRITIADTDTDMTNNTALEGATITITEQNAGSGNTARKRTVTSDATGAYELSGLLYGTYVLKVSKDGYIPVSQTITINKNTSNIVYNVTIEAVSNENSGFGLAHGQILDAGTGLPVSGLTLYIRSGLDNTTGGVVSMIRMGSTSYTTTELPAGNYTVQIVDERTGISAEERYTTSTFYIKILGNTCIYNQNGYVSNGVAASALRIVLTWGETPTDLDSHLVGPSSASSEQYHICYYQKQFDGTNYVYNYYESEDGGDEEIDYSKLAAMLDVDDTDSYGPETVTILQLASGTYTYAVHDFTNSGDEEGTSTALANSGATVQVYRGETLLATYHVPTGQGGTLWTVFTYDSATGKFNAVNRMTYATTPYEELDPAWEESSDTAASVMLLTDDVKAKN